MTRPCTVFCASLLALFMAFTDARATDYDGLIAQARAHLEGGRVVDALAASNEAVKLNPADFKGHYYGAMALMSLGRFDDSEAAAAQALTLAPEAGRPAVVKLRDTVKARKDGDAAEQVASSALAEGLFGKAAPAYERAWLAGRTRPEFGLKAADLYANRLKSPIDAGRVLRQVITAVPGRPEAEVAQTELTKIAPALRTIAQEHVGAARNSSGDEALRRLALAEAADPDFPDIFIQRARVVASGNNVEAMRGALKDLARLDQATPAVLGDLPDMPRWLERPEIGAYLVDLIAQPQFEAVGKVLAAKAEERRKADEARRAKELKDEQDRLAAQERQRRMEAEAVAKNEREVGECQELVEEMAEDREKYEQKSARIAGYKHTLSDLDEKIATDKIGEQSGQFYISLRPIYERDKGRSETDLKSVTAEYNNAMATYRAKLRTYNKKCLFYTEQLDLPDRF